MDTTDPLPSWRDGPAKAVIVDFVARVTRRGIDFVPEVERIAAFDNDGTLWCEQPIQAQVYLLIDRVRELTAADPAMAGRQPYKALLEHDLAMLDTFGKEALEELHFATHAGMTMRDYNMMAHRWQAAARNPELGRRFVDLVYQPQIELLDFLRSHAFSCFIVTAGSVDFVRAVAEARYGIPPEQVIGSSCCLQLDVSPRGLCVRRLAELRSFNDGECKIENIGLHIGRRPILACGNSDGDLAMLRYIAAGAGPRLALLLHHDDAEREFAYDRSFAFSPLAEGLDRAADYGIKIVSMQRDWTAVFADPPPT